jgi:3-oxoacyl-[acyl-carrier-protein] synthase-3
MERVILTRIEDGCCRHLHVRVDNAICTFHNEATTSGIGIKLPARASYACLQMNGKEVFRFAVRAVPQVIEAALQEAGLPQTG